MKKEYVDMFKQTSKAYLNQAYFKSSMPPVQPTPWYRKYTKAIGKAVRRLWSWC